MLIPLVCLTIGAAGIAGSLWSFNRTCERARANYDSYRATAPRGLAEHHTTNN